MSKLIFVEQRPVTGRIVPIQPGTTIGRDACDVILPDPEVSRRHAIVRELDSMPAIEDTSSRNGTFVNGERIKDLQPLRTGDEVRFGNTVWRVESQSAETRTRPPLRR
jgi:pSer/pThr/pTyr-binding forkhead associated (FHA) protein